MFEINNFNDVFYERVNCTDTVLQELLEDFKDNSFLVFCVELHQWAMKNKKDLIYYEEPYILKAEAPSILDSSTETRLTIKRPGKYAFSVESEKAAEKLHAKASSILSANIKKVKGISRIKLNCKVLPTSSTVKLSIGPAYSVSHPSAKDILKVFEEKLLKLYESVENTENLDKKKLLKADCEELENQIKEWKTIIYNHNTKKLTLASRCGNQFRFSYYNEVEEKRCQVGFGDVIIFYGSPKPTLSGKEPSKKRTDTRDNDPYLLYHGDFEGAETYISL